MNANIFFRLEKTVYPTGTIAPEGEHLRVFAKNETAFMPPVRLPSATTPFFPIFIPTKRNVLKNRKNIERIMKLAAERDNTLLVLLCSAPANKEDVELLAKGFTNLQWIAIDGPFSYEHSIHHFETSESPLSWGSEKDQAQKRNFALQLARYMKWESIFFLDDDVAISSFQLDKAYNLLQTRDVSIVGFNARHFPDNSVAMHIHRWLHDSIDSFLGTGAMAVKTNSPFVSFFPHIYNEDWLFLLIYRLLGEGNIIWAGTIKQKPYNPYKYASRATSEETGDILGESLAKLALVLCQSGHRFKDISQVTASLREYANEDFWSMEINNRLDYLHNLREGLKSKKLRPRRKYQAMRAIDHSIRRILGTHGRDGITGKELADWTLAWCRDIELWNSTEIPETPYETLADAFAALSFTNQFSYRVDNHRLNHIAQDNPLQSSRPAAQESNYRYPGHTVKPRDAEVLEGLWLAKTVQDYLADKELRMEKIVTSADMLRFDRPTHWLTNVKPLFTVSMIVAYSESIAQVRRSVQDIIKWTHKAGPSQLIIWVYGNTGRESEDQLDAYRNRIIAQLAHDVQGTHIQVRSSVIASTGEGINRVIDRSLNDISFAYWKQKIKAEHPIYVTNSRNELLRLGTFCQFMHQEQILPRHSLKYSLKKQVLKHDVPQEISQESDANALHTARVRLAQGNKRYFLLNRQRATKKMVHRMHKAQLTWVQLDDLAYDVVFHNPSGEESVEYTKKIVCIPVTYDANSPGNKHSVAKEIIQTFQYPTDETTAYFIIIQGRTDDSWETIERYHDDIMAIILERSDPETLVLSTTYRISPGEMGRHFKRRVEAIAEYSHWLQNHAYAITMHWKPAISHLQSKR